MSKNDLKAVSEELKAEVEQPKAVFSFRINIKLLNKLRKFCEKEKIPMGVLIERLLEKYFD